MGNHWTDTHDLVVEEKTLFRQVGWKGASGRFYDLSTPPHSGQPRPEPSFAPVYEQDRHLGRRRGVEGLMALESPADVISNLRGAMRFLSAAHAAASEEFGYTGTTRDVIFGLNTTVEALVEMIEQAQGRTTEGAE